MTRHSAPRHRRGRMLPAGCSVLCCATLPQRLLTSRNPASNFPAFCRKPHSCSFTIRWSLGKGLTPPGLVAKLSWAVPGKDHGLGGLGGREECYSPSLSRVVPSCGEGTGPCTSSPLCDQPSYMGLGPSCVDCRVQGSSGRFGPVFAPVSFLPSHCSDFLQSYSWA